MADTFAKHILALTRNSARPAQTKQTRQPKTVTTYASVVLLMAVGATDAEAAQDGLIASGGGASTGSTNISMVIPERLDIRGIADVDLSADHQGTVSGQTSACISGHGSDQYHLSAIGSGNNGAFEAIQGERAMRYEVAYSTDSTKASPVTMGEALERLTGAGGRGCGDNTNNATLSLRVTGANQQQTNPDLPWRGALTLLLAPE